MSNDQLQQAAPANNATAAPFSVAQTGIDDRGKRLGWYRSPIDRAVLAQLNRKNDWQPLLHPRPPYTVEITYLVKPERNAVEVSVSDLLSNRFYFDSRRLRSDRFDSRRCP